MAGTVMERKEQGAWLDRVAIGLSGLCLVHCVATSVVLTVLASAGGLLLHPAIHEIGLGLAMVFAGVALGRGWSRHRAILPAITGSIGLLTMGGALLVPHGYGETVMTLIGVSLVAFAHHRNRRAHG